MEAASENKRVAFVTGATSGLGLAISRSLIDIGFIVYGAGRRKPPLDLPDNYVYVQTDVALDESVNKSRDYVLSQQSHIDLLVCAAGFGISGSIEDTPIDSAIDQFNVNFFGVARVVCAFLPGMREQGRGRIIIIGSIAGKTGMPFQAYYSASKFALEGFVESLRYEVRRFNIEACIVEPGDFKTGFTGSRQKIIAPESPYYNQFERVISVQEHDEIHGLDPAKLGERIARLAVSKRLPARLTIGPLFERLAVWIRRILPDAWFEAFYRMYYHL